MGWAKIWYDFKECWCSKYLKGTQILAWIRVTHQKTASLRWNRLYRLIDLWFFLIYFFPQVCFVKWKLSSVAQEKAWNRKMPICMSLHAFKPQKSNFQIFVNDFEEVNELLTFKNEYDSRTVKWYHPMQYIMLILISLFVTLLTLLCECSFYLYSVQIYVLWNMVRV